MTKPSQPRPPSAKDQDAGFDIQENFQRFSQRDDVFNRSLWDPAIHSEKTVRFYETYAKPLAAWRKVDGYTQRDYALRNASWHVTDLFAEFREGDDRREGFLDEYSVQRDVAAERLEVESTAEMSREIKHVAKLFGADLVGITGYDERWVYTHKYSRQSQSEKPNELPEGLTNVIVIAQAMDHDLIQTVPSALSGTATGLGYSRDTLVLLAVTQYIRNLGYQAVASLNDTALAIPLAIQAGLGEYGRHGLLITKEFGPRVRLGKIFTDLPLEQDGPIRFGVKEFCESCRKCANACPAKAIPHGDPNTIPLNSSGITGVRKWSVDGERCFKFWASQNSDCSICIRVCPYNKDFGKWYHRVGQRLAGTPLRGLMVRLDGWLRYGVRHAPEGWWKRRAKPR
ncbi:MAG: reductive dehalogenase [Caldilineaceae bacterium]|nr:reductive dehalogenase [Caldilineaceae bacterium]